MAVKFEALPPSGGNQNRRNWFAIFAELREQPGDWALVAEDASTGLQQSIRLGKLGDAKPGEFEARGRNIKNQRGNIYARFVGASDA